MRSSDEYSGRMKNGTYPYTRPITTAGQSPSSQLRGVSIRCSHCSTSFT